MKSVYIASENTQRSKEYARMIELELLQRGISISSDLSECSAAVFAAHTINLLEKNPLPDTEDGCTVICCVYEITPAVPNDIIVFYRPIDIQRLVKYIAGITETPMLQAVSHHTEMGTDDSRREDIGSDTADASKNRPISEPDFTVDRENMRIFFLGSEVKLSKTEFELFSYLFKNRGKAVSSEELLCKVWQSEFYKDKNLLTVYIRYLRQKLDEVFDRRMIITVRNKGYMLR